MDVLNLYPSPRVRMQLHLNPISSSVMVPRDSIKTRAGSTENLMNLNRTAAEILVMCDGSITGERILVRLCNQYGKPVEEKRPWVRDFLIQVQGLGLLDFSETPTPGGPSISVTGSFTHPTPAHATVELLSRCDLRCRHCYYEASPEADEVMPYERAAELFELLSRHGVLGIELTGGEALIHPDFQRIFRCAVQTYETVALLTTGTHISDGIADLIASYREQVVVSVSLDAPSAEIHDAFRGAKGAFDRTCAGIRRLSKRGVVSRVSMSVFEDNKWLIENTLILARELGARLFTYEKVEPFGRGRELEIRFTADEYARYADYEKDLHRKYASFIGMMTTEQMARYNQQHNCGAGWRSVAISPLGVVRPCVMAPKGFMDLGNIFTQSYEEVFGSPLVRRLMELRAPVKGTTCPPDCKSRYFCRGCFVRGFRTNTVSAPRTCSWIKDNMMGGHLNSLIELEAVSGMPRAEESIDHADGHRGGDRA